MSVDKKELLSQASGFISEENEKAAQDLWAQHKSKEGDTWEKLPDNEKSLWRYTILRQPFLTPKP